MRLQIQMMIMVEVMMKTIIDGLGMSPKARSMKHQKKKQVLVNEPLPLAPLAESSQPKTYDELLPKLSPAMWKMCLSRKAQEEKSKKDEWFSFL
jgi:hypothetical protein